jgi:hypothetical protein
VYRHGQSSRTRWSWFRATMATVEAAAAAAKAAAAAESAAAAAVVDDVAAAADGAAEPPLQLLRPHVGALALAGFAFEALLKTGLLQRQLPVLFRKYIFNFFSKNSLLSKNIKIVEALK